MSLKIAYRNWSAEGMPHVHEFEADSWSFTADHSLVVRNGSQIVATVAGGEWIAVWDPSTITGAAAAAPAAGKAQKAPAAPTAPAPAAPAPPAASAAPSEPTAPLAG